MTRGRGAEYCHLRDTSGAIIASISSNTTQKLSVRGKNATLQDNWFTPSMGQWYTLAIWATKGTSATDGVLNAAVYSGNDRTTPLATYSASNVDVGTVNIGQGCYGKAAGGGAAEYHLDDLAFDDGRTSFIPAPAANVKPTASAGPTQYVARNSTVTLSGTDADSDGTVASRQWTCTEYPAGATAPTITNATSATASAPVAVAGIYRFSYVVTDNGGLTSTPSEVAIAVYPLTGEDAGVYSQFLTLGAWTKYGSAATVAAGLNDADVTTGVLSPTNPTSGQGILVYLNPLGPGDVKLYLSGRWIDAAVTRTVTLYKPDSSTVVKTWTVAPTNSDAEVELVVDAAGLALIPNLADKALMLLKISAAVA